MKEERRNVKGSANRKEKAREMTEKRRYGKKSGNDNRERIEKTTQQRKRQK